MGTIDAEKILFGMRVQPLREIVDERGKVMHMLRKDSKLFTRFGEVYFSMIHGGAVKAWKKHLKMTQHIAVPVGRIRLVAYDDRADSPTYGRTVEYEIGEGNYVLVKIPPGIWYGFKDTSQTGSSLIANCTDMAHDPSEVIRESHDSTLIPYQW